MHILDGHKKRSMQKYSKKYSITCKCFLMFSIVLNFSNISSSPQKILGIMIYTALSFISKSRQPFNLLHYRSIKHYIEYWCMTNIRNAILSINILEGHT